MAVNAFSFGAALRPEEFSAVLAFKFKNDSFAGFASLIIHSFLPLAAVRDNAQNDKSGRRE